MCNIGNNYAIMRPFNTKTSACGHPHTAKDPTVTAKDPSVTYIQRLDLKSCHVAIHFRCDTPDLAVVEGMQPNGRMSTGPRLATATARQAEKRPPIGQHIRQ